MIHSGVSDGKAEFDHIYDRPDPRDYYRTLSALDYEIPQQALPTFETLLDRLESSPATVLDVCCSYGVNAALMRCELCLDDLFERYQDVGLDDFAPNQLLELDRQFYADQLREDGPRIVGLDLASNAISYARGVGLLDDGWAENLEVDDPSPELAAAVRDVELITITGGVGYITERTFDRLLSVFDDGHKPVIAAFVMRRYSYDEIARTLAKHGLATEREAGRTYPQRRFASRSEQETTLQVLASQGIDPTGKEADGRYHADLYVSVPERDT
jgi:SAM-dependent methyltransferase